MCLTVLLGCWVTLYHTDVSRFFSHFQYVAVVASCYQLFSAHTKYSVKLRFLTPRYAHLIRILTCTYQEVTDVSFLETLRTYLNG